MSGNKIPLPVPAGVDQRLSVSNAVVPVAALPQMATLAFFDVQGASVMATFDGSDPTTTNGHQFDPGDSGTWSRATAEAARFIRLGSVDGVVHITPMVN